MLIAYDRDEAGDRAAEKLAGELMAEGLDCYRVLFPKGWMRTSTRCKVEPAAKSLGVAIRIGAVAGQGQAQTAPGGERGCDGAGCRARSRIPGSPFSR